MCDKCVADISRNGAVSRLSLRGTTYSPHNIPSVYSAGMSLKGLPDIVYPTLSSSNAAVAVEFTRRVYDGKLALVPGDLITGMDGDGPYRVVKIDANDFQLFGGAITGRSQGELQTKFFMIARSELPAEDVLSALLEPLTSGVNITKH